MSQGLLSCRGRIGKQKDSGDEVAMCLYSSRSWTTTNHSARNIHYIFFYLRSRDIITSRDELKKLKISVGARSRTM